MDDSLQQQNENEDAEPESQDPIERLSERLNINILATPSPASTNSRLATNIESTTVSTTVTSSSSGGQQSIAAASSPAATNTSTGNSSTHHAASTSSQYQHQQQLRASSAASPLASLVPAAMSNNTASASRQNASPATSASSVGRNPSASTQSYPLHRPMGGGGGNSPFVRSYSSGSNGMMSVGQQQQQQFQQQQQQQRIGSNPNLAGRAAAGGGYDRNVPERNAEDYIHTNELGHGGAGGSMDESMSVACGWSEVDLSQDLNGGGVPPSARSLHAGTLLNGIFYVFGGYDGSQRVNTFHAFSFAEKRWSPVLPSAHSSPPPSPRDRHVCVAFGNTLYIHGGFDGTSRVGDCFAFDFSTMSWREVVPRNGRPPTPRHSHAAVVHQSSLYVFGGYDGSYKCDLHEFDFTTSSWSLVPAVGRRPRARYRSTCVVHKNLMILYGGHDGTRHLSDTHIFDFETRTWAALNCEGTPPIPRDSHVAVVHSNSMYVFGGSSGSAMNDLHELQIPPTANGVGKWRPVHTPPSSSAGGAATLALATQQRQQQPRPRFCHVAVVYNDSMFCFGGYDGADRLNDFIRFDFAVYDLSFEVPQSTILSDLRSLINDPTLSDITFVVEEQPIYAHKLMLMRCSYFQALFLGQMKESSLDTIHLEQVRYPIFLSVLEYLYTDHVVIPLHDAMELFEAADLFCIPRLKTMCEKRMLQSITVDNAASIFHASDMHSASALRQKTKKFILSHFEDVSKSQSFEEMGRRNIELVFELLRSR